MRLLGYCRRSTDEQPLAAQAASVGEWAAAGGHQVVDIVKETLSGSTEPEDRLEQVLQLRAADAHLVDVAAAMNEAGIPTPGGSGRWWPSHVSRLLRTQDARTRPAGV